MEYHTDTGVIIIINFIPVQIQISLCVIYVGFIQFPLRIIFENRGFMIQMIRNGKNVPSSIIGIGIDRFKRIVFTNIIADFRYSAKFIINIPDFKPIAVGKGV